MTHPPREEAAKLPVDRNTFIREWVNDLRSGKFSQCTGRLARLENGCESYCCLGVACVTATRLGINPDTACGPWRERQYLPAPLAMIVGDNDPKLAGEWATSRNDDMKQNFNDIADAIECTWPEAFAVEGAK